MRGQFAKTMLEVGQIDPSLFVLVGDIGAFGLREFAARCPGRFLNAGIREQAMASAAAGLALTGFTPVIHSITPFVVERCFEQIKDDFCYQRLPGNVVSVGGGLDYSALGCTHHSYSDIALMKSLPGTQVFTPGTQCEFDRLFREVYRSGKVNYFRLGGRNHSACFSDELIQAGKGIVARPGDDITIVTLGSLLDFAMQASSDLGQAEVLYFHTIKPFDAELVRARVARTRRVLVVEDHSVMGGLADEVRRALDGAAHTYSMASLGLGDEFVREYGPFDHVAGLMGISPPQIVAAARRLLRS